MTANGSPSSVQRSLTGPAHRLLAASTLDALGTGIFVPVSVLYFTETVGISVVSVGIALSIAGAVGVLAAPISGHIVDRIGAKPTVVIAYIASALAFATYIFITDFGELVLAACLARGAEQFSRPARKGLATAAAQPGEIVRLLALVATVRNAGYGAGSLLAVAALAGGRPIYFHLIIAANSLSYVVAAGIILRLPARSTRRPNPGSTSPTSGFRSVLDRPSYTLAAGLNAVLLLPDSVLQVAMPLWIVKTTHLPHATVAILFFFTTVCVVATQVRFSSRATSPRAARRLYVVSGRCFSIACLAFLAAAGPPPVLAAILLTAAALMLAIAETTGVASEWFISTHAIPENNEGHFLSVFSTGYALQRAVGPLVVTLLCIHLGRPGWIILAVTAIAATMALDRLIATEFVTPSVKAKAG